MPVSWAQRYATLRANAIQVLAALTTLGMKDVAQLDLAAALAGLMAPSGWMAGNA